MQSPAQLLPSAEMGTAQLSPQMTQLIYQPENHSSINYRVTWYGSENEIHFEKWCKVATPNFDGPYEWIAIDTRTLMEGLPTGAKELHDEMEEYYNYCIVMEMDCLV